MIKKAICNAAIGTGIACIAYYVGKREGTNRMAIEVQRLMIKLMNESNDKKEEDDVED